MRRLLSVISLVMSVLACGGAGDSAGHPPGVEPANDAGVGHEPGVADSSTTSPDAEEEPSLAEPAPVTIDEEKEAKLIIESEGMTRFAAKDLPPGALFDPKTGALTFRPDFTQSGSYDVTVTAFSHKKTQHQVHVKVTVTNTIAPPEPTIVSTTAFTGGNRLVVRQQTDAFLDSPGRAGRTFDSVVVVPTVTKPAPVVISLHGFSGAPNANATSTDSFRIEPHDPENTYWWGYADSLPGAPSGSTQPYTLRRVLHLLDWLRRTQPNADPDRVFATGGSMGGAGALSLGLLFARHFAGIEATIAQAIPRRHRPSRIAQLTTLWGSPAANLGGVWDTQDCTRAMRDVPEARDQFVFTKHGKDDPTIHFGAVLFESPLTNLSFYASLEKEHIGHLSIWDEGAHGPVDPVLGANWWDAGWSRIRDAKTFLTRRAPFPAFSGSNANDNPGDGKGNGKVTPFDVETGFSANVATAGDTGWNGAIAGAINRFLRWNTPGMIDTPDRLALPLFVTNGPGDPAPMPGYPTKRDRFQGGDSMPIVVDVTPRRTSAFRLVPGETVKFRFGTMQGTAIAASDGSVTIPQLPITRAETLLEIERQ